MREQNKPLLSICIPTYNRAIYLEKTIESIISQKEFNSKDVEIVISDNCSTDETQILCEKYSRQFDNFHYYRNETNIRDKNFPTVLGKANGIYRKLCNDTLLFNTNALSFFLKIIKENIDERPVFFFDNKNNGDKKFNNLDEFLRIVSFNITWIGGFGVWEDFCGNIENHFEGCYELLWQVPFMLNYVDKKHNGIVFEMPFSQTQKVDKKNISYGLYKVFYENFLGFINNYVKQGKISKQMYNWLEKDLLFNFFPVWIYNYEKQDKSLDYSKEEDLKRCVFNAYKNKKYFILFYIKYICLKIKRKIIS